MADLFDSTVARAAGITATHALAEVLVGRREIIELTERSHEAALRPREAGGLPHRERAALACRVSRLNGDAALALHYEKMMENEAASASSAIADPAFDGGQDRRVRAIIRHADLVTVSPKDATAADIEALRGAGLPEDDIVRLSQLIAFVNYQVRVIQGLRLMMELA